MPWLETAPVNERERFIADYRLDLYTMTDLCARYNVSRKTGYKWVDRMEEGELLLVPDEGGLGGARCQERKRERDPARHGARRITRPLALRRSDARGSRCARSTALDALALAVASQGCAIDAGRQTSARRVASRRSAPKRFRA